LWNRVWEYIRKLNPGVKGRRHCFRRGGTKTSSKTVKSSYFDNPSKEANGHSEQESFHNPKIYSTWKKNSTDFISIP
jgi:hypothetical protein